MTAVLILFHIAFLFTNVYQTEGLVRQRNCSNADPAEIQFLYMTSFGEGFNSSGSAVGMMIAVDRINSNDTILANYTLTHTPVIDSQVYLTPLINNITIVTQCDRTVSLTNFVNQINDPCRRFISVIGSGCSVATEPVAELSHYWGLNQVILFDTLEVILSKIAVVLLPF